MSNIISKIRKYDSSSRTNPTVLFEILFGSQQAVNKTATVDALNKKLAEDFRRQIESNLPVFYLIDAEEIVNGVLEDALSPDNNANKKRGLSKYLSELRSSSIEFVEYYGDAFLSFEDNYYTEVNTKDGSVVEGFDSAYIQAYNYLISKKQEIITEVHRAISNNLKNRVSITEVANDLNDVIVYINGTVADLVDTGLPATTVQKATSVVSASAAGRIMRESFKKYPKTQIEDAEKLINGFNSNTMILAVAANYDLATTDNHNAATRVFEKYLKNIPVSVNTDTGILKANVEILPTAEFKVGNIVAAGHAAVKSSNKGIVGINTPALQLALAILQANNKPIPGIVKAFVGETGHAAYAIDINTDYENFAGSLLNLQASLLRSQRSAINSGVISAQETAFLDNVFKEALGKSFLELRKTFVNNVRSGKVGKFLIDKFAQSPTLTQSVRNKLLAIITDDKSYRGPVKNTTASKSKSTNSNIKVQSPKTSSKISPKSSGKNATAVAANKVINTVTNLGNLLLYINQHLQDVISANMGDGSRRDILNYRTGRLAGSVKVERLSQSREGMITAFYSYMKNPYATFSQGGRQQNPKSRDPKLLISTSIREIAAQQVANKLRAVSV
jgi:hypothetical protein